MKATPKITRSNYEAFMVDYWDGTLTPEVQEQLLQFLNAYPNLQQLAEEASQYTLPNDGFEFDAKDALLKEEISDITIEHFLVSELEHDLLAHEQNELQLFLAANPQYQRDRELYSHTILRADKGMVYPHKNSLRKGAITPMWIRYGSVAAAACLILGIGILRFNNSNDPINNGVAIENNKANTIDLPGSTSNTVVNPENSQAVAQQPNRNAAPLMQTVALVTSASKQNPVQSINSKESAAETFYSYSKNRKSDDYLDGLVNSYLPNQVVFAPIDIDENEREEGAHQGSANPVVNTVGAFATKNLNKIIKDTALANQIQDQRYSVKTRIAKTVGWATGKASNGKVQINAIPNTDGTLSAMSFSNGKYNYTKRF